MESETDRAVVSHSYKFVVHDLETCASTRGNKNTQGSRTRGGASTSTTTSLYDFSKGDLTEKTNLVASASHAKQKQALIALLECHLKATETAETPSYATCGAATTALIPPGLRHSRTNGIIELAEGLIRFLLPFLFFLETK